MIAKMTDKNMVQITCTLQEQNLLIHALIHSKFDDEDFVKKFADDPDLTYCVERAKENAAAADTLLAALTY